MRQDLAEIIFKFAWGLLLLIALLAQWLFKGKLRQKGGIVSTILVVTPYLVVFGLFSARGYVGAFRGNIMNQAIGIMFMIVGVIGYFSSILYLGHNWAVSAVIKEGHELVNSGPYRLVRHPMYFFMILVVLGSGLLVSNYLIILYTPVVAFLYYLRSKKEEEMLLKALPGYGQYVKDSKMLIPGIF